MKHLLALLIGWVSLGQAQILLPIAARVIHNAGSSSINTTPVQSVTSSRTNVITFGSAVTAGNLLTIVMSNDGLGGTITGCTDTQSNTWTLATAGAGSFSYGVEIWYAKNVAAGSTTVTCTMSTANTVYIQGNEWSGASTTAPLDSVATPTTGSSSVGPLTTSLDNELLLVGKISNTAGPCTGYTQMFNVSFNAGSNEADRGASTTAGSYTASSCSNGVFAVTVMAALK